MPLTCSSLCAYCAKPSDCAGHYQSVKETPPPVPLTNPKELRAEADGKPPLDYLEAAGDAETAYVMKHGADKYGYRNYTVSPCKVRTYTGAVGRHLDAIKLGEDIDPDSGRSHWAHIRACCDVVMGADSAGMLVDDRKAVALTPEYNRGLDELAEELAADAAKRVGLAESCPHCCAHAGAAVCGRTRYRRDQWQADIPFCARCPLDGSTDWKGD